MSKLIVALVLTVALGACSTVNLVTVEQMEDFDRGLYGLEERQDQLEDDQYLSEIRQLVSQPQVKPGCWYEYKDDNLVLIGTDPDVANIIQVERVEQDGAYCIYTWYAWLKEDGNVTLRDFLEIQKPIQGYGCSATDK